MNRHSWQPLIQINTLKRARTPIDGARAQSPSVKKAHCAPPPYVFRDNVWHLPMEVEKKRGCCSYCKDGYALTACIKCDV